MHVLKQCFNHQTSECPQNLDYRQRCLTHQLFSNVTNILNIELTLSFLEKQKENMINQIEGNNSTQISRCIRIFQYPSSYYVQFCYKNHHNMALFTNITDLPVSQFNFFLLLHIYSNTSRHIFFSIIFLLVLGCVHLTMPHSIIQSENAILYKLRDFMKSMK